MEIIYAVEADMVATALCTYTVNFFNQYEVQRASVTWQDVELAVYLVIIYGEVCKGVYHFHSQYASDQIFHFQVRQKDVEHFATFLPQWPLQNRKRVFPGS
jgi:hypothetical protein